MTFGVDKPIIIWAYGDYVSIVQEAISIYHRDIDQDILFSVVSVNPSEMESRLRNEPAISMPNIILVEDMLIRKYLSDFPNKFLELENELDSTLIKDYKKTFIKNYLDNLIACPCSSGTVALYYRKDIFESYGYYLSNNLSWEDFIEYGNEIHEDDNSKYLLPPVETFATFLKQSTGELFYDYNYNVSNQNSLELFELINDLKENDLIPLSMNYNEINENIIDGNIISIIGTPFNFSRIKKLALDSIDNQEWDVVNIPKNNIFSENVNSGDTSWMVINQAFEEPNADYSYVFDFLARMFDTDDDISKELYFDMANTYNLVPAINYMTGELDELSNNGCFYSNVIELLDSLDYNVPNIYYGINTYEILAYLNQLSSSLVSDTNTITVILHDLNLAIYDYFNDDSSDELDYIEKIHGPDKVSYYNFEYFDSTGMIIRVHFVDGNYFDTPVNTTTLLRTGDTSVTIEFWYRGISSSINQTVTVLPRTVDGLIVSSRDLYYLHHTTLQNSDFNVFVHYDVGEDYSTNDFTISSPYISNCSDKTVTISYTEGITTVTESITISVVRKLENIIIQEKPKKLIYLQGEKINLNGIKVKAIYSTEEYEILNSSLVYSDQSIIHFPNGENQTNINIYYRENGIIKNKNIIVYRKIGALVEDANITQEFDRNGYGTLNLNTGLFKYYYEDFVNNNPTFSIELMRVYDHNSSYQSFIGDCWRLNYQQEVYYINNKWTYETYDGKKYEFVDGYENLNSRSEIRNEELGLDLFIDEILNIITLVDRENNSYIFEEINNKYRLTKILNFPSISSNIKDSYSLEINYDNYGKILNIIAGATINEIRPTLTFNYTNNLLSSLSYLGTTVCEYQYSNSKLTSINKKNININQNYSELTTFTYNNNQFSIFNHSKKDNFNNYQELRYVIDSNIDKVTSFSIGYTENDRDITNIEYVKSHKSPIEDNEIQTSTILTYKNIVNIYNLNSYQVVSNYSYKMNDDTTIAHLKPKMILSSISNGMDYLSILDNYSDDLILISNDFETDTENWINSTIDTNTCITGTKSIKCSLNHDYIKKTFTNLNIQNNTTCYVSLWVLNALAIKIKLILGEEEVEYLFSTNVSLIQKWQYYVLPLGKISSSFEIEIKIMGVNSHLDDFKIIKSPYELPNNNISVEYNSFGNKTNVRVYNPIIQGFIDTIYYYDDLDHQFRAKEEKINNVIINKTIHSYQNGLIDKTKNYVSENIYLENNFTYSNDICTSLDDMNGINQTFVYSTDEETKITIGELESPTNNHKYKYYTNSINLKNVEEDTLKNNYIYNNLGNISSVEAGFNNNLYSTTINFSYDTYDNLNQIIIGNNTLLTENYDSKKKLSTTYGNGTTLTYSYDNEDRINQVLENNIELFSINYIDSTKKIVSINHNNNMVYSYEKLWLNSKTYQYLASKLGYDLIFKAVHYSKNSFGNINLVKYYISNSETPFENNTTTLDKDGYINKIERTLHGAASIDYDYDFMHRLKTKEVKYINGYQNKIFVKNYKYENISIARTTNLIEEEKITVNNIDTKYNYEYYVNGNISKIYKNNILKTEYTYDSHNRLLTEINYELNKKFEYEYEENGNIIFKKVYNIINGNISLTPSIINSYDYDTITPNSGQNQSWNDQLKSYNNIPITYDNCGNPLSYLGKNMTWSGNKLTQIDLITMSYDYNGLRITKGNKIYYWYNGNIVLEVWKENNIEKFIYYYYDESGVSGMYYDNQEYYFSKNILGDVIAIYDNFGNIKCRYVYDSFGNHKIYDDQDFELTSLSLNIGNINPFRYRSYYYDKEFDLYYLKTRYYDSNLGRFISPDSLAYADSENIMGYNLYAYCNNNPVMYSDGDGTFAISALIIGLAVGLAATGLKDLLNDGQLFNGDVSVWEYVGSGVAGLLGGAAGQAGNILFKIAGAVGSEIVGGIISENENYSWDSLKRNVITGLVSSGISEGLSILGKRIAKSIYSNGFANASKAGQKQLSRFLKSFGNYEVTNQSALDVLKKLDKFTRVFETIKSRSGNFYGFIVGAFGNIIEW